MVITIEPGIYIPDRKETAHLPSSFRGVGIRVEDDVLVTREGPEVLTLEAPKSVEDIEALMRTSPA
jgi:Xaa-Pro aminopeptidase